MKPVRILVTIKIEPLCYAALVQSALSFFADAHDVIIVKQLEKCLEQCSERLAGKEGLLGTAVLSTSEALRTVREGEAEAGVGIVTDWMCRQLVALTGVIETLAVQVQETKEQVQNLTTTNEIILKVLRSKEESLDTASEELLLALLKSDSSSQHSLTESLDMQESADVEILETSRDETTDQQRLERVFRSEGTRKQEVLRCAWQRWQGTHVSSVLEDVSLEGWYKARVLSANPLKRFVKGRPEPRLPSPALFNVLFSLLDLYHARLSEDRTVLSFPDFLLNIRADHISDLPLHRLLASLHFCYAAESAHAYTFSRLLQVFDSDPVLPQVANLLATCNAELRRELGNKKARDLQTGGALPLARALKVLLTLRLSLDPKLWEHVLRFLKPTELNDREWSGWLHCALQSDLPIAMLSPSSHTSDLCIDSQTAELLGQLFTVTRGDVLDCLLQVYDLYVDQLYIIIGQASAGVGLDRGQFARVARLLDGDLSEEQVEIVWQEAQQLGKTGQIVRKDAILLALLTCPFPTLAALPLVRRPDFPPPPSEDLSSQALLEACKSQRLGAVVRTPPRVHRKTLSIA